MSLSSINVELFIKVPKPPPNPFFLDSNGVTIKLKEGFGAGTIGKADNDFSGKVYTAVSQSVSSAIMPCWPPMQGPKEGFPQI